MFRFLRLACCAVCLLSAISSPVLAQSTADPFWSLVESDDVNPFGEEESAARSAAKHPSLSVAMLEAMADRAIDKRFCLCAGEHDDPSVERIEQSLRRRLGSDGLAFEDAPLGEVAAFIQGTYQIPIQLDMKSLDEVGIGPDEPLTASLHSITLRSALRLMLDTIDLTYIIQNEVLLITTPETADSALVTCVYHVRDLRHGSQAYGDFDPLIDTIVSCIAADTWADNGGECEIRPLPPGFLVISQTVTVHEEICALINSIRELKGPPTADATAVPADSRSSLDALVTEWNGRNQ